MVKSKQSRRARNLLLAGEFAALGAASVILLVFLASSLDGLLIRQGQGAAVITAMLVDLTNTDRASYNAGELEVSPTLTAIAQAKADDMATKGYFAHNTPDGKDPWYWFQQGGYTFTYAGENLAVDFSDSADVERAWMNSPTHRANLLNTHFTQIGIATAVGTYQGHQTTFVVQEFGTPAHAATTLTPQNLTTPTKATDIAIATTVTVPAKLAPKPVAAPTTKAATTTVIVASAALTQPQEVLGANVQGLAAPAPTAYDNLGLTALWNVFAASPATTLRTAYYLFGFLILIALVIETGIELRRHHLKHVGIVAALFVLMVGLFITANTLVFTDPQLVETAAAIQSQ